MCEIIWYGRGGGGAFTAARLLGIAASLENRYALAFPTFGPERRGALVLGFTKLDDNKILDRSEIVSADFAIVLDETLFSNDVIKALKPNGTLLINTKDVSKYTSIHKKSIGLDATTLALNILKKPIVNTAFLGAFSAISKEVSLQALQNAIKKDMRASLVEKNIELLKTSYESINV
ncbi:MAG: 2-oxoacid:acceptor oxidoreductase family protein [Campylobacteraceae bacterium]|jgi:pyruvate ferredoxin oxidoreductase gamma subunit|nr:2-oxoacid:acceptor oxidoreductase family protein [Campylobacteraceae bacterium]